MNNTSCKIYTIHKSKLKGYAFMNTRKILLCVTALSMLSSTLTACGQKNDNAADNNTVGQSDTG